MHEEALNDLPSYYRDTLLWCLYSDLRDKVRNLDEIVERFANIASFDVWARVGGVHSILFVLKSFDIDVHKGWKLGTTLGYDMTDSIRKAVE